MFSAFNGVETFFLICAIVGGIFVVFRLIMQFMGVDSDSADVDLDHADSDAGFQVLSIQSLSAFFMMFGLVGLAMYRQSGVGVSLSIMGGSVAGAFSVWVIGKLFQGAANLESSGTIGLDEAYGSTGTVYLNIPAEGTGRVIINLKSHQRECDAREVEGAALATGTPIRVVDVNGTLLIVEAIK